MKTAINQQEHARNLARQLDLCRKASLISTYRLVKAKRDEAIQSGDNEKISVAEHNMDIYMDSI